ncbi:MAG TPA: YsnF/AvaK domain-containing protein [Terracidiphilus sp.]|nr:YsnF/AvaK domain-containing protein [Terracidiphilus sp.]
MAEINPKTCVVGYFPSEQNAEDALRSLHSAGFTSNQIGVAGHLEPAISVKKPEPGFWHRTRALFGGGANPQDTRTGASQPLSTGQVAGPEGMGHYDLDAGDFHKTLTGLKLPDERSRYFSDRFGSGEEGVLVSVDAGSRWSEAETILRTNGADLGESMTPRSQTSGRTETAAPTDSRRMQLYGEVLRVHRDRVQRGEVGLRKETVTETKNLNVPVSHDELVVERKPVTEERAAPGARIGEKQEMRIPLSEERVSVEKEPVVREEVEARKREVTDVESREEKVRREELKVEDEQERERERRRSAA